MFQTIAKERPPKNIQIRERVSFSTVRISTYPRQNKGRPLSTFRTPVHSPSVPRIPNRGIPVERLGYENAAYGRRRSREERKLFEEYRNYIKKTKS